MEGSLHGGSTSSDFPLIPVRKKIQKTRKARFHRRFFGNLVMAKINEQQIQKYQFKISWIINDPDSFYRAQYENKRRYGKHKDDWDIGYWWWSLRDKQRIIWID